MAAEAAIARVPERIHASVARTRNAVPPAARPLGADRIGGTGIAAVAAVVSVVHDVDARATAVDVGARRSRVVGSRRALARAGDAHGVRRTRVPATSAIVSVVHDVDARATAVDVGPQSSGVARVDGSRGALARA